MENSLKNAPDEARGVFPCQENAATRPTSHMGRAMTRSQGVRDEKAGLCGKGAAETVRQQRQGPSRAAEIFQMVTILPCSDHYSGLR
jgi:hypothetical protein